MTSCGEAAVRLLEQYGVTTVFGVPGAHTIELYRGLAASPIHHISTRHEQGAGFMAHGYARVTGTPGVCFVIGGPGVTNVATPMGQAYAESLPMLVISGAGSTPSIGMGYGNLHELRHQRQATAQMTAFSHTLQCPEQLPEVIAAAYANFQCQRPRPVHIEIPLDVAQRAVDFQPTAWQVPSRPAAQADAVARAAGLLASATSPVIVFGGGAAHAAEPGRELVELLDAPAVLTINGKGILPRGHRLSLGSNLQFEPVRRLLEEADVVLAVGTEFGETDTWLEGTRMRLGGRLIRIDIDARQLSRTPWADLAIVSDSGEALAALVTALKALPDRRSAVRREGAETVRTVRERVRTHWRAGIAAYQRLVDLIYSTLPDAIVVGDSAQHAYEADHLFEASEPRSYMTATTGYGTLGFALPAALGAKIAAPHRPVVCLIGDAGLQFTLPELATAVQERIPVVVLVWMNAGYEEIRFLLREQGIPPERFDIDAPDVVMAARGFGCEATVAGDGGELERLLTDAGQLERPLVVVLSEEALLE
jgi:acetolactate synthase-1/2/3 large subunit